MRASPLVDEVGKCPRTRPIRRSRFVLPLLSQVLGGRFLDRWVLKYVRLMVGIRETPNNPKAMEHLVSR